MIKSTRFSAPVALAVALAIPVFAQGCSAADDLCCKDPGATATIGLTGQAQASYTVLASTVGDLSAVATGSLEAVTTSCRNIATDLDATTADKEAANAKSGGDAAKAWCDLAVARINAVFTGAAAIKITFAPPQCQASVSAKANCQAKCDVGGKCDIKANPPQCTGGKVELSCKGECTAKAGASLSCEGSCDAACEGSCQATGGVACSGKCEGTCEAGAAGGTDTGIQADGTCKGTCKGTCAVTAPGAKCSGSCKGSCKGTCKATGEVAVKCDGDCKGTAEPIKCTGGKLEGGCKVDAKCDANCDASVSAKAECTPPALTITGGAGVSAKYTDSLKVNIPDLIVVAQARGEAFAKLIANVAGSAAGSVQGDLSVKVVACLAALSSDVSRAGADMGAAVNGSVSVVTSVTK